MSGCHDGWFCMHRKILDSMVFKNEGLLKVWVWCLARANYETNWVSVSTGRGESIVKVDSGEFVFGRKSSSKELNMDESTLYKRIKILESNGNITVKRHKHFSIITIVNWDLYQRNDDSEETPKNRQSNTQSNTHNHEKKHINSIDYEDEKNERNTLSNSLSNRQVTGKLAECNTLSNTQNNENLEQKEIVELDSENVVAGKVTGIHPKGNTENNTSFNNSSKEELYCDSETDIQDLKPKRKKKHDDTPYGELVELYHEILSDLPPWVKISDPRKTAIRSRWNTSENTKSVEWWKEFFDLVKSSNFLMGKTKPAFTCNLDWILKESNFLKIIEGKYSNR